MLRLEKTSKAKSYDDLLICVRDRERFFNYLLWQALGIALALHTGAFIIFHIHPFKSDSSFIFIPIRMQADLGSAFGTQITLISEQDNLGDLPAPPLLPLSFPDIPLTDLSNQKPTSFLALNSLNNNQAFTSLERRTLSLFYSPSPFPLFYFPFRLSISGELSERELMNGDLHELEMMLIKNGPLDHWQVTYQVRIDEKSGFIFWYDKKPSSNDKELDSIMEKILLSLQFAPNPSYSALTGEIHFFITKPNKENFKRNLILNRTATKF